MNQTTQSDPTWLRILKAIIVSAVFAGLIYAAQLALGGDEESDPLLGDLLQAPTQPQEE